LSRRTFVKPSSTPHGWRKRASIPSKPDRHEVPCRYGQLPSVVVFRLRNMRPDNVERYLEMVLSCHATALEQGAVVSVAETRIRVRPLPIRKPPTPDR
jgi:hypothetical protein